MPVLRIAHTKISRNYGIRWSKEEQETDFDDNFWSKLIKKIVWNAWFVAKKMKSSSKEYKERESIYRIRLNLRLLFWKNGIVFCNDIWY